MSRNLKFALAIATVFVVAATALTVVLTKHTDTPSGGIASDKKIVIDVGDVSLAAEVITPRGVDKPALVVMPASWGQPETQYQAIGRELADDGFLVVSYAQRGFEGSGGQVDLAGAATQADASKIIDWALRNTAADPSRVGMYGLSYGAGVSLLAAAKDPRVKAVVALSTWADIAASYDPNNTPSTRALATLLGRSSAEVRDGSDVTALRALLAKNPRAVGQRMKQLSPTRSPMNYVSELNRNKPAIMMANGFQDSLFGPQQLVSFYDKLTTPKRLQLAPGDHGGPEASALSGRSNPVAAAARSWLDHYLHGTDNGIDREAPIVLNDVRTGAARTLKQWPTATAADTVALGRPNSKVQTGPTSAKVWRAGLAAGADTVATSGPPVAPFGTYTPPSAQLLTVTNGLGLVWTGAIAPQPTSLGGTPRVTVNVASTKSSATIVAYLYDVTPTGIGQLMSVQPYSMTGLTPGRARPVSFDMQPTAWTLPSGDRMILVIDTADPRYTGLNPEGARLSVSATAAVPGTLSMPKVS